MGGVYLFSDPTHVFNRDLLIYLDTQADLVIESNVNYKDQLCPGNLCYEVSEQCLQEKLSLFRGIETFMMLNKYS